MLFETPRTPRRRGAVRHGALGLLAAALLLTGCESQADKDKKAADAAYREKLAKAQAIFAERCKTAGVVIHRTVKDVEGIELKKIRPKLEFGDKRYFDPMFEGAAMAGEAAGEDYIRQMLFSEFRSQTDPARRGSLNPPGFSAGPNATPVTSGYRFVEHLDLETGKRLRFTLPKQVPPNGGWGVELAELPIVKPEAQFTLDFEDLVDPADRALWIAGTRIKVLDNRTGEVLAMLTRYVFDAGFGVSSTGRWPWQHADTNSQRCPSESHTKGYVTRFFVDTVLIPKQGD